MPRAKRDLRDIKRYIAEHAPSTAKHFIQRIRDRVRKIGVMPPAAPMVSESAHPDLREIYVAEYRVIYRIRDDSVHILMIIHGARLMTEQMLEELDR
jgi:plasmid stabilization system protein ParE